MTRISDDTPAAVADDGPSSVAWGGAASSSLMTASVALPNPWAQPLTDLGNARRLVCAFGDDIRYLAAARAWLVWDGRRWARDETGQVDRHARAVGDWLLQSAYQSPRSGQQTGQGGQQTAPPVGQETGVGQDVEAAEQADAARRRLAAARVAWAKKSQSRPRLEAMVALAQGEPGVTVRPRDLDGDPWLLCTRTGTLDLREAGGSLRPHRRGDLITRLAPVDYEPGAACPLWERTLARVLPDPDVRAFVQRSAGYALTGSTREQCVFLWHGHGRNGKTTVLEALRRVLGDYAAETPAETLTARGGSPGVPNDLARLAGARLVTARETEEGQRLAEGLIKHLSGGDAVPARYLFGEWFEFTPALKLFLATNHRPAVRGTDEGIWRRLHLVPFGETLADVEVDRGLGERLRAEAPGILAWAVRGCLAWQEGGLGVPDAVRAATREYRADMDLVGQFLDERCLLRAGEAVAAHALHRAFAGWAGPGAHPVGPQALSLRLQERGIGKKRGRAGVVYDGVRLLCEDARPLCEDARPLCEDARPLCEDARPLCEDARPLCEDARPLCEDARPLCPPPADADGGARGV